MQAKPTQTLRLRGWHHHFFFSISTRLKSARGSFVSQKNMTSACSALVNRTSLDPTSGVWCYMVNTALKKI